MANGIYKPSLVFIIFIILLMKTISCLRLFTALLKEWLEYWAYGRKYLNIDLLVEFEADEQSQKNEQILG